MTTVNDLNLGDVFRLLDHESNGGDRLWRKERRQAREVGVPKPRRVSLGNFAGCEAEVVERADTSPIRRVDDLLILKGGDVILEYLGAWRVHRCTPGERLTLFTLRGSTLTASRAKRPNDEAALGFNLTEGSQHLGRPPNSMILAYQGRVYARATGQEATGKRINGGYKRVAKVDGVRRLSIAGLLTLPDEGALHDIIQDHFGPGSAP